MLCVVGLGRYWGRLFWGSPPPRLSDLFAEIGCRRRGQCIQAAMVDGHNFIVTNTFVRGINRAVAGLGVVRVR